MAWAAAPLAKFRLKEIFRAKKRSGKSKAAHILPVVHPGAVGIDIGATEIVVAVPVDRDLSPVRGFQTFTQDLAHAEKQHVREPGDLSTGWPQRTEQSGE